MVVTIEILNKSICWRKSYDLVLEVYSLTKSMPREEMYGLVSQMRRSSVSICSNIAEGLMRGSKNEFIYFLRIAKGSCAELYTQIMLAYDLGYSDNTSKTNIEQKLSEVMKMLYVSIRTMRGAGEGRNEDMKK